MLSALAGVLAALSLFVAAPVAAQDVSLPPGDDLCKKAVQEAGLAATGKCQDACNNASLPLIGDPSFCPQGLQCCYIDDGSTENASCVREGVNQSGTPGVCVDEADEGTACAASAIGGGELCDNPAQICCLPAPGYVEEESSTASTSTATPPPGKPITLPDPLGGVTIPVFIGNAIRVFSSIAGALALLMFVYGGVMWILSGGDSGKIKDAQKILMNAVIGLVLIFCAYLFTSAILQVVLAPTPAGAQTLDICGERLMSEGLQGGCVQASACSGGNLEIFSPRESLCEQGEVCCFTEESFGGSTPVPPSAAATSTPDPTPPTSGERGGLNDGKAYLINPLGSRTVPVIIGQTIAWIGRMAGALFFFYLLWGGVEWMTARGDMGKTETARKRMVAASAGIAVVLLAYMIVASIINIIPQR